jgi:hypothetical protein
LRDPNDPAHPVLDSLGGDREEWATVSRDGLTKRELIAAQLMAGLLSGRRVAHDSVIDVAFLAVTYTDALIAVLKERPYTSPSLPRDFPESEDT